MAKYTTLVRSICESKAGLNESVGSNSVDDVLSKSWDKVFTTSCTFFDEDYRSVLCSKILKHYYMREIGAETFGLWQLWMNTRLEEIMPYYNQLYDSAKLEFNPFNDVDLTKDYKKDIDDKRNESENGTVNVSSSSNDSGTDYMSDSMDKTGTSSKSGNKDNNSSDSKTSDTTSTNSDSSSGNDSITGTHDETQDGSGNGNNSSNGSATKLYSDTPQGGLKGINGTVTTDGTDLQWLTNVTKNSESSSGSNGYTDKIKTDRDTTEKKNWGEKKIGSESVNGKSTDIVFGKESWTESGETTDKETDFRQGSYSKSGSGKSDTSKSNTAWKNATTIEGYLENIKGKSAGTSYSKLLNEFRSTLLNIDMMVINEFNDMFMGIW